MGLIRLAGILFPGKRVRIYPPLPSEVVVSGSAIWNKAPLTLKVCEKSPWRCNAVGTVNLYVVGVRWRRPSKLKNQNNLFLITGPPTARPYWLKWNAGRGLPFLFAKKEFAFSLSLRKKSHKLPCSSFVPPLLVTLTYIPPPWPYSASRALV